MNLKFSIFALAIILTSCVSITPSKEVENQTSVKQADSICHVYHDNLCVAPIIVQPVSKIPDSTCNMYQGDLCIAPIISRLPNADCSMYNGDSCVAPIVR